MTGSLLTALAVFLLAPMLAYPFGSDQGSFATAADVIGRGGQLYRDVFEIKPPGVYYLFRAGFVLFGHSMFAIRLLDLLWTLAAAWLLFLVGKTLLAEVAAAAGALFFVACYAFGFDFWHTAQCDGFTSLPLAAALLLAAGFSGRQVVGAQHAVPSGATGGTTGAQHAVPLQARDAVLAIASGVCIGLALVLKFTVGAVLVLPVLAAVLARGLPVKTRLVRAALYVLGCALPVLLVALLLLRAGAFHDMLQIVFGWNSHYGQIRPPGPQVQVAIVEVIRFLFGGQYLLLKLIGLLGVIGVVALFLQRKERRLWWFAPGWLAAMLLGVIVQGKYFNYHWLPALPPLGLLAGEGLVFGLPRLVSPFAPPTRRFAYVAAGLLLLALTASADWAQFNTQFRYLAGRLPADDYYAQFATHDRYFSLSADLAVAKYVQEHTRPGESISVFGLEPLVYFLADRPPATRFMHAIPLLTPWSPPEWRRQHVQQLQAVKPRLILLVHNDWQPWTTGWNGDTYSALPTYPDLTDLLRKSYRPVGQIEDFEIWERR